MPTGSAFIGSRPRLPDPSPGDRSVHPPEVHDRGRRPTIRHRAGSRWKRSFHPAWNCPGFGAKHARLKTAKIRCDAASASGMVLGLRGGEVAEWFKAHAWKACVANPYRGFESPPLRQFLFPSAFVRRFPIHGRFTAESRFRSHRRPLNSRLRGNRISQTSTPSGSGPWFGLLGFSLRPRSVARVPSMQPMERPLIPRSDSAETLLFSEHWHCRKSLERNISEKPCSRGLHHRFCLRCRPRGGIGRRARFRF